MHTVSPSYSPTVAHECLHIKCTVGLYDGNPNDLYSVDELKYFVDRTAASILLRAVKWLDSSLCHPNPVVGFNLPEGLC